MELESRKLACSFQDTVWEILPLECKLHGGREASLLTDFLLRWIPDLKCSRNRLREVLKRSCIVTCRKHVTVAKRVVVISVSLDLGG